MQKIIELKNLTKHYPVLGGVLRRQVDAIKALDGVDLDIYRGECLGLVGESGCGKTTMGKSIIRLDEPTKGNIFYFPPTGDTAAGTDIAGMPVKTLKRKGLRGKLQMVFQDPTTSLNPRMLIKNIIAEPLKAQNSIGGRDLESRVMELLGLVGLTKCLHVEMSEWGGKATMFVPGAARTNFCEAANHPTDWLEGFPSAEDFARTLVQCIDVPDNCFIQEARIWGTIQVPAMINPF